MREKAAALVEARTKPGKIDILFPLAITDVYHRYRLRIDRKMKESPGTVYLKSVAEHQVRLQRLAEGIAAFCTAGTHHEARWFIRPCIEVFASQCLLQFGHVNHPEKRAMTKEERADAYYIHSDYIQHRLLIRHREWGGHTLSPVEIESKIAELETKLASKPYVFYPDKAWHKHDLESAFKMGMRRRREEFGASFDDKIIRLFPILKDFVDAGIHGNSFAAAFMYTKIDDENTTLGDHRGVFGAPEWTYPFILASFSAEMLAHEFDERKLIIPMLNSAMTRYEHDARRMVDFFPTALLGQDFVEHEAPSSLRAPPTRSDAEGEAKA